VKWSSDLLHHYPELAIFLVVGLGYWIGGFKVRNIGLGSVTGSLVSGLLLGYFFDVPVSNTAKSILFLLFMFGIGYQVGPRFFATMKGEGVRWLALAVVQCVSALAVAWAVATFLKLDPGFSGGLLSGSLTQSSAIGTAIDAIKTLPIPADEQERIASHVAVADALCYVFGTIGVIFFCSHIGPWLLRADIAAQARALEEKLGIDRSKPGVASAWHPFEMRAYRIVPGGRVVGLTVADAEARASDARVYIERIRRGAALVQATPATVLEEGDVVVASGSREFLVERLGANGAREVEDRELLDIPVATFDIYVTNKQVEGRTLAQIGHDLGEVRGVFLREIVRGGEKIPFGANTVVERGDVVKVTGPEPAVMRAQAALGHLVVPSADTDYVTLGLAMFLGALLGIVVVIPVGSAHVAIGTSVGVLLAGLLVGHFNGMRPLFGRIPPGATNLMTSFGLAAFVGMVGITAGPHFLPALKEAGVSLLFGGMVVCLVPLLVGLYFGRYVLKLEPVLLLGGIAGAQTQTAGMAAVQDRSGSPIAVLGYSGTVAVANILLTMWGTLIVRLVA
jgi:putative transport protein